MNYNLTDFQRFQPETSKVQGGICYRITAQKGTINVFREPR